MAQYYYSKYNAQLKYADISEWIGFNPWNQYDLSGTSITGGYNIGSQSGNVTQKMRAFRSYTYDSNTNTYSPSGMEYDLLTQIAEIQGGNVDNTKFPVYLYFPRDHYSYYDEPMGRPNPAPHESGGIVRFKVTAYNDDAISGYVNSIISGEFYEKKPSLNKAYTQGSFINTILVEDGTYPNNGRHTDGYWYVRGSIYTPPNITPPTETPIAPQPTTENKSNKINADELFNKESFTNIKDRLKKELARRSGHGNVSSYSSQVEFEKLPDNDSLVNSDFIEKIAFGIDKINPDKKAGSVRKKDDIIAELRTLDANLILLEAQTKTSTKNDCAAMCTGMCVSTCTGTCSTGCLSTCLGGCSGGCGGACSTNCTNSCSSCTGTCSGSCSGTCNTSCTGSCVTGCSSCGGSCSTSCSSGCSGCSGCGGSCSSGCSSSCDSGCKGCGGSCSSNCSGCSGCGSGCSSGCSSCGSGCSSSCSGCSGCGGSCSSGCSSCGGACSVGCGSECSGSCSGYCDGSCSGCYAACSSSSSWGSAPSGTSGGYDMWGNYYPWS